MHALYVYGGPCCNATSIYFFGARQNRYSFFDRSETVVDSFLFVFNEEEYFGKN
jgi:hypothetical protein